MFRSLTVRSIALGVMGAMCCAALPAAAQYYRGPGYYYDDGPPPPPPRYRYREYYGPDPYYRGYGYAPQPRGNPNDQPWRPRYDPRNGGTYCVLPGYTVQDGVCKPYRGR